MLTDEYPYTLGCFTGTPESTRGGAGASGRPRNGGQHQMGILGSSAQGNFGPSTGSGRAANGQSGPPQAAIDACASLSSGASCSFSAPKGTISGTCGTTPNGTKACVPAQ